MFDNTERILEDQECSKSIDMECVEFLDSLHFESGDFYERIINYIDESI